MERWLRNEVGNVEINTSTYQVHNQIAQHQ